MGVPIAKACAPVLSVVVASFNNHGFVLGCLRSLASGGVSEPEVVVVDNASTDGTPARIAQCFPGARLIQNDRNKGHCRAMNQGINAANGKYILALDGDTVLHADAARLLVDFLETHPTVAIVAPRMLNEDGSIQETARAFPGPMNGLWGRQSLLTSWFPNHPIARRYLRRDVLSATVPFEVDWVSAAAMAFRKTLPDQIGYWDEGIRGYWVDADWCKTAHRAGSVYCLPAARVTHVEQNRKGVKKSAARIVLFHRGAYQFYRKHCTLGWWDPRAIVAALALGTRALALMAIDQFLPPASAKGAAGAIGADRAGNNLGGGK